MDQKCEAKKQVQMIQNNPPLYSTTYFGRHTCQLHQAFETFPIDTSDSQDSHMIRFDHPDSSSHQHQNQIIQLKVEQMTMPSEKAEEWSSPSEYMSSEVACAVEAFGFNPARTSSDLSWPYIIYPSCRYHHQTSKASLVICFLIKSYSIPYLLLPFFGCVCISSTCLPLL